MPSAGGRVSEGRGAGWFGPAVAIVLAITAARIVALWFARIDLYVDEAQYWLWGQELAFGYYSKPPLIAWVIRATTELAGSDAAFWVRLPAPLFHAATALILGAIAARRFGRRAGVAVAASFATLPMVAVGSLLISTDTIMFPFLALALAGWLRLLEPGGGDRPLVAAGAGVALGLAFLAKYAAIYFPILALVAALLARLARPLARDAVIALAAFAAVAAPNLVWNALNGAPTLSHTVDNTGLRDGAVPVSGAMVRFLLEQFLVFGPILFAALLLSPLRRVTSPESGPGALLLWLSLPIVAVVTVQALLAGANANWAAAAYLAGTLVAVPWLLRAAPWLLWASLVINGLIALALPLLAINADTVTLGRDRPILSRYLGIHDFTETVISEAISRGAVAVVAEERSLLADLHYTGRDSGLGFFAWPHDGAPRHHYDLRFPFPGTDGPVLAVAWSNSPPCSANTAPSATVETSPGGAWRGKPYALWLVPADCWAAPGEGAPNSP